MNLCTLHIICHDGYFLVRAPIAQAQDAQRALAIWMIRPDDDNALSEF